MKALNLCIITWPCIHTGGAERCGIMCLRKIIYDTKSMELLKALRRYGLHNDVDAYVLSKENITHVHTV